MKAEHKKQYLNVYLQEKAVGKLCSDKGSLSFTYNDAYLKWDGASKLSSSLPLQTEEFPHQVVSPFFSGLLPDGIVRTRIAKYLGLSEGNTFSLLAAIGGDCAGAISLFSEEEPPALSKIGTYRILDDREAFEILSMLEKRPLMVGEDGIRISGAGAQDKLMVSLVDGKIAIPTGTTPSTHIIKTNITGLEETVQNEYFCMRLAKQMGLPVPDVWIHYVNQTPFYLIKRYDRQFNSSESVKRLHQEDFCQAMQIPPELKYENEGGPKLRDCFRLLDEKIKSGCMPGKSKITLLQCVIFNFLIGNGDAHGKNFSLLYDAETESLAPFYDLMNTTLYTNVYKARMAMKIDGKYKFKDIRLRHILALSKAVGFREDFARKLAAKMIESIKYEAIVLSNALNDTNKNQSPIYKKILDTIISHGNQLSV